MTKRSRAAARSTAEPANGESKAEKFKRIGVPRVKRVLEAVKRLHNIANRSSYEYTEDEAAKIITALRTSVGELEAKFKGQKPTTHFEL